MTSLAGIWEPPGAWTDSALCRTMGNPDLWFPTAEKGSIGASVAKEVCSHCKVRLECLQYALRHETPAHRFGIYGGLSSHQRERLANSLGAMT